MVRQRSLRNYPPTPTGDPFCRPRIRSYCVLGRATSPETRSGGMRGPRPPGHAYWPPRMRALGPPRPTGRREVYAWASVPYSAPGGRLYI